MRKTLFTALGILTLSAGIVLADSIDGEWGIIEAFNNVFSSQVQVTVASGTAPFAVTSTTLVANLNADLLDGVHASDITPADVWVNVSGDTMTGPLVITPPTISGPGSTLWANSGSFPYYLVSANTSNVYYNFALFGVSGHETSSSYGPAGTAVLMSQGIFNTGLNIGTYGAMPVEIRTSNTPVMTFGGSGNATMTGSMRFDATGSTIANAAGPLNLGTTATTSHSLTAGGTLVGGALEVNGYAYFDDTTYHGTIGSRTGGSGLTLVGRYTSGDAGAHVIVDPTTAKTNTSGTNYQFLVQTTYNQTGTGSNYGVTVAETRTAVGTGIQRGFSHAVGGVEVWGDDPNGNSIALGCNAVARTNSSSTLSRGELVEADSATDASVIRATASSARILGAVQGAYSSTASTVARGAQAVICLSGRMQIYADAAITRGYACTSSTATAGQAGCYLPTAIDHWVAYAGAATTGAGLVWAVR